MIEIYEAGDLVTTCAWCGRVEFDGEWLFGTYMMAAMGFGQVALASDDPTRRAETIPISGFVAMARELADIRNEA